MISIDIAVGVSIHPGPEDGEVDDRSLERWHHEVGKETFASKSRIRTACRIDVYERIRIPDVV